MPFSVESIRNLNKVTFLAINMEPPKIAGTTWETSQKGSTNWWKFSMYSASPITLGGKVDVSDVLGGMMNTITSNKLVKLGIYGSQAFMENGGLVPQFDVAVKYCYNGSAPLSLSLKAELVLQTSVIEDYIKPIEALAYLTFPRRTNKTVGENLDDLISTIESGAKKLFGEDSNLGNIKNNIGALVNSLAPFVNSSKDKSSEGNQADGWNTVTSALKRVFGNGWFLNTPPTFAMSKSGSGLDLRYGSILITDVYIKGFTFDIPTLFFEGGYPAHIPINLELGTFRPLTADALVKIMQTQVQR